MAKKRAAKVLAAAKPGIILRASSLSSTAGERVVVKRLTDQGALVRLGRGIYARAATKPSAHHSLAEVALRVPNGVICLLSALRFHELTTQFPSEVWIAIDPKAWRPVIDAPPVKVVRFSGTALSTGIEVHTIEGVPVRIYSAAKTIADCFKYRNKIGLDVALEALRDGLSQRRATVDELWNAAKTCRVTNVMRPYLEAMT